MQDRLASGPHAALGVDPDPTAEEVRQAFLKLSKRYHPAKFARCSTDIQKWSNEVFLALRAAHDQLARLAQRSSQIVTGKTGRISPPQGVPVPKAPTPPFGIAITTPIATPGSTPPRGVPTRPTNGVPSRTTPALSPRQTATPATPFPARPMRSPSVAPPPDPSGSGKFPVVKTPPPTPTRPGLVTAKPGFDEKRVLAAAHELLSSGQWTPARQAFHALATRMSQSRHYRALLAYAKAREMFAERRPDDARLELEHALQLDPELTLAKDALAELFGK
jgi:hypothetical protein